MKVETEGLIDYTEAARLRGCGYRAIGALVKRGRLPFVQIGQHKFLRRKDVLNFKVEKPGPKGKQ